MRRFFVMHLDERDLEDRRIKASSERVFEVQLLGDDGRAVACGHIGPADEDLAIEGYPVPREVIEAAVRQFVGQGDYVDESGRSIRPF